MKSLITVTLIFIVSSCATHFNKLSGTYFSSTQDSLIIINYMAIIKNSNGDKREDLSVKQTNKKLKLKTNYYSHRAIYKNPEKYYFIISYCGKDSIILIPFSQLAKKFFNNKDSIVFKAF